MSNVYENNILLVKADALAHKVFSVTKSFPKSEIYGITSQLRRAALSVPLNIVEGYARFKTGSHVQFLEIAFGSLKETQNLIRFCLDENLITTKDSDNLSALAEEVARMLYSKIGTLRKN